MIDDMLRLANDLVRKKRQTEAALRRATSTAYYASFHALCETVAGCLCSDSSSRLYERVYRLVDHNQLNEAAAHFAFSEKTRRIRTALANLREKRLDADYRPGEFGFSSRDVLDLITSARSVVDELRSLDASEREELAANLLLRSDKTRLPKANTP